jgi:hypothetical protein
VQQGRGEDLRVLDITHLAQHGGDRERVIDVRRPGAVFPALMAVLVSGEPAGAYDQGSPCVIGPRLLRCVSLQRIAHLSYAVGPIAEYDGDRGRT